uniref:Putative secreted protein n=1 Tax=Ixodes ricinus TaxID=34613 RepID=A0A6B0U5N7_IXORI
MQHQDLSILVAGWTSMFLLASTTRWTISSKTGNPFFSIFEKTRTPLISTSKEAIFDFHHDSGTLRRHSLLGSSESGSRYREHQTPRA